MRIVEKKMRSAKNAITGTKRNRIVYLSKTYEGSVHDKRIIDKEKWQFPEGIKVLSFCVMDFLRLVVRQLVRFRV